MNSRTWNTIPRNTIRKLALDCFKSRASGTITRYLRVRDIDWFDDHSVVHVPESKTDIYRRGQDVLIAKSSGDSCPAVLLDKYIYGKRTSRRMAMTLIYLGTLYI